MAASASASATAPPPARTVIAEDGAQRLAWFICDATDGPMVAVVGTRTPGRPTPIRLFLKRGGGATTQLYAIGDGDAGAGQVYFPLTRDGRPAGSLHMVNPGMLDDALTPTFTSIDFGAQGHVACRWAPGVRFLGFDPRRSVQVRRTPQGLVYESFDFDKPGKPVDAGQMRSSTPSLRIVGGQEEPGRDGSDAFLFTNKGYSYRIDVPGARQATPARLSVRLPGRPSQAGALTAYTFAAGLPASAAPVPPPPRPATPEPAVAGAGPPWTAAVAWSGTGRPDCPGPFDSAQVRSCLADFMRKGGASPQAVAFALRMTHDGRVGWIDAYRRVGKVGVAHAVLPFMANTNETTWLLPAVGDPIRPDDRQPTAADKALPGYRSLLTSHPNVFPVGASELERAAVLPSGLLRIEMRQTLAECHACKPIGAIHTAFTFSPRGAFLGARVGRAGYR